MQIQLDFAAVLVQWPFLLRGVLWTLGLTAVSMAIGMVVGIACAWARASGPVALRVVVGAYVELIRNTPFIVQLFFIFFGLPSLGVKLGPEVASVIAMVLNLGAYATEIIRAGIESIPKGQIEAGLALDLKRWEIFRFVILKPALKTIYPALTSQFILLMLSSAVVSVISADDLTSVAANIQSETFRSFEVYIVVAVIYLLLSLAFNLLFKLIYQMALNYPDRR